MRPGVEFELIHLTDLDWIQVRVAPADGAIMVRLLAALQAVQGDLLAMMCAQAAAEITLDVLAPAQVSGDLRARLRSRAQRMGADMRARRDLRAVVIELAEPEVRLIERCARLLVDAGIDVQASWTQGPQIWYLLPRESSQGAFVHLYRDLSRQKA